MRWFPTIQRAQELSSSALFFAFENVRRCLVIDPQRTPDRPQRGAFVVHAAYLRVAFPLLVAPNLTAAPSTRCLIFRRMIVTTTRRTTIPIALVPIPISRALHAEPISHAFHRRPNEWCASRQSRSQGTAAYGSIVPVRHGTQEIEINPLITHTMALEDINRAFDLMHAGESIRSVVRFRGVRSGTDRRLGLPVPHISCWTCHECEVNRIRHAVRRRKPWRRAGCSRAT